MTPLQKIKREILLAAIKEKDFAHLAPIGDDTVDQKYFELQEESDWLQDHKSEFRHGQVKTGLPSQSSRHYEAEEVAHKCCDGSWIGWTYWHGGGKHGEPGEMPWMEDAYDLDVKEEEKVVVVREFKKVT